MTFEGETPSKDFIPEKAPLDFYGLMDSALAYGVAREAYDYTLYGETIAYTSS